MGGYIGSKAVTLSTTAADVAGNAVIDGDLTVKGTTVTIDSSQAQEIRLGDNDKMTFGDATGGDLQIYHDGTHSYIDDAGTGNLRLRGDTLVQILSYSDSETMAYFLKNGAVGLYHNNSEKLTTTNTGIDVTGTVTADGLTVDHNTGGPYNVDKSLSSYSSTNGVYLNGNASGWLRLNNDGTGSTKIDLYGSSYSEANVIKVYTASAERMRIKSDGNVQINGQLHFTDTGSLIARPTTNVLSFNTNGSERMRIDSSGNVGIGTSSPSAPLDIVTSDTSVLEINSTSQGAQIEFDSSSTTNPWYAGIASNSGGDFLIYQNAAAGAGDFTLYTNGSERMRITSGGNVGIGTTLPSTKLDIIGSSTNGSGVVDTLRLRNTGTTLNDGPRLQFTAGTSTSGAAIASQGKALNSADLLFYAGGNTERMRIDSSGNFMVGRTSPQNANAAVSFEVNDDTMNNVWAHQADTTTGTGSGIFVATTAINSNLDTSGFFYDAATNWSTSFVRKFAVRKDGVIFSTNTSISALSDRRIKENIVDATDGTDGLDVINGLRVRKFDYKSGYGRDLTDQVGFIAQEVETVLPSIVDRMHDMEYNDDGESLRTLQEGKLVPILVKAIQEQQATITSLESRIAALEAN